jgi:membrane protein YqaA with SNARE-associated domain
MLDRCPGSEGKGGKDGAILQFTCQPGVPCTFETMSTIDWVWQSLLAVAFGIGSAIVPFMDAETYVVGIGISHVLNSTVAAIGVAIGQTVGKVAMFMAVRYRKEYHDRHSSKEPKALDLDTRWGRFRQSYRDVSKRLLDLLSHERFGVPVTLLSATASLPPLYAVALIAGASRMRLITFTLTVLAGRLIRFILLSLGVSVL